MTAMSRRHECGDSVTYQDIASIIITNLFGETLKVIMEGEIVL